MANENTSPNTRVPCTFEDCGFFFKSEEQMKKHKAKAPQHDYCRKCDEDFPDEEDHLIHKIKSTKHVACPMCGEDFKSEGGRDAHIRQAHRADQDITCVGCATKFVRAGALMAHIENNQCETISSEAYAQERARKAVLKEAVAKALNSDNTHLGATKTGSDVTSDDGGVPVDNSLLDDPDTKKTKTSSSRGPPSGARSAISNVTSRKHWPTLGSERNSKEEDEQDVDDDLMVFSTLSVRERGEDRYEPSIYGQSVGGSRRGGLNAGTVTESGVPTNFGLDRDSGKMASSVSNDKWDPNRFFDSCLGEYVCPCSKKFKTLADFEVHLSSGAHSGGRTRCPACHRLFGSNAALVSHCESASVKCQINQSHNFNGIIQDISGGVIEASGHHNDGTVRYEAGQIMDIQRTLPASEQKIRW